jgi:hypothetical protein
MSSDPRWRKSPFCESGACVEVRDTGDGVIILRSSEVPDLTWPISIEEYDAFVAGVKAGAFDRDKLGA